MKLGNCDNCARRATCTRSTGVLFGGCVVEYRPIEKPLTAYERGKEAARTAAAEWQAEFFGGNNPPPLSWGELANWQDHFSRLGRRFGLLREFRENGII